MSSVRRANKRCASYLALSWIGLCTGANAQNAADGLEQIIVTGVRTEANSALAPNSSVSAARIERRDAVSAADVMALAPSASVQTNSRGETLVFLRNVGERQVAYFYDGALLNVPWDNRVDLSIVPASLISGVEIAAAPVSAQYGASVAGGVVNFTPPRPDGVSPAAVLRAEAGESDLFRIHGAASYEKDRIELTLAAGHEEHGAAPLSSNAILPYSQPDDARRTNTDANIDSAAARLHAAFDNGNLELTLLYLNGEKGIAPVGDHDPEDAKVRFWRYPEIEHVMAIVNGDLEFANGWYLKGTAWSQYFNQTIDSYETVSFNTREAREIDDNDTYGARFALRREFDNQALILSFNGLSSVHEQTDIDIAGGAFVNAATLSYEQRTISSGLDYEIAITPDLRAAASGGVDWMSAPQTGDKPDIKDFVEWNASAGVNYRLSDGLALYGSASRRARFPTLRELFGEAINRFHPNPELEAETSVLAEMGVEGGGEQFSWRMAGFYRSTSNVIDQQNVTIGGDKRRQRINLDGAETYGIEMEGAAQLTRALSLNGHLTATHIRRRNRTPDDERRLAEKPVLLGGVTLQYDGAGGFGAQLEIAHRGRAYSPDIDDIFLPLNISTQINMRISQKISLRGGDIEIYFRADNLNDALVEPQLGLPAPGRWLKAGFIASL